MASLDPTGQLLEHMASSGLRPKAIQWDGEPHRFPGKDQQRGTNGWYVAFADRRGAVYGDWREPEVRCHWKAHDTEDLSREKVGAARQAVRAQFEEDRRRREETSKKKHAAIAKECQAKWKNSEELVSGDFPYLIRKQFEDAPGARVAEKNGNRFLIVPMYDPVSRMIQSLQWIATDGTKKNHPGGRAKGCCGVIDEDAFTTHGNDTLYICEGWATGVTIHLATDCTVVVAFSAVRPWSRLVSAIVAERQVDPFVEYFDYIESRAGRERGSQFARLSMRRPKRSRMVEKQARLSRLGSNVRMVARLVTPREMTWRDR